MEWMDVALLVGSGLMAGFIAGLIGVGGGVIFAPVLFFYFQSTGVASDVIAPLTIGTSLLCTIVAAFTSAWHQFKKGDLSAGVALRVGLFSAVSVSLMTRLVTTQPWYNGTVFQVTFSVVLVIVVLRMLFGKKLESNNPAENRAEDRHGFGKLAAVGTIAGVVSSASGVGGGVVLVPAYNNLLKMPIHRAVGTSSASIVIISSLGVLSYLLTGNGASTSPLTIGHVDLLTAFVLAFPSIFTARLGVWTSHQFNTRALQWSFGIVALFVAFRLLLRAFG
jgi:uncharacterized membrane protein YfcA